ncbi:MAG TPA: hypothetical protein VLY63_28035, partial [Anaerolineae bacterium]|nr:hypothetical protein [Anaerolineae bacterium]
EGAQVGASNYTFRCGPDVVSGRDLPAIFSAVLCGHIHRAQTITHDLNGKPLPAPVICPGSIERTSFAERTEHKGYVILTIDPASRTIASIQDTFVPLPVRPMVSLLLEPAGSDTETLMRQLATELHALHPDSVVRLRLGGPKAREAREVLSASYLRDIAPPTMNIDLAPDPAQYRLGS